ncbi:MAG TPA: nodulation protein NfeD [Terriglobia bacterium]|nr:nodulation protein NfeD [Terriglobia bacterium]
MSKLISCVVRAALVVIGGSFAGLVLFPVWPSVKAAAPAIVQVEFNDIVHPVSAGFVKAGLAHARAIGAEAVVIRLNTPGGFADSMREIVEAILDSPVPVIVWVGPSGSRAVSAGFFILQAADAATMAAGTNTGAAHPVSIAGTRIDEVMEKKIVSDAAAFLRSYSTKRGRNAALAEQAVTDSRSFTDKEALDNKLIDAVARDIPELLGKFDGKELKRFDDRIQTLRLRDAVVEHFEMTKRQKLLSWILNPNIAFILGAIGILGLYIEITHPGLILPGVVGGISLILALFAFTVLPVNVTGVLLILLAIVLFVMEANITSHGILAIGGILALVTGGLMLVEGPIPELTIHLSTVLAVAIPVALITVFLLRLVLQSYRVKTATGDAWMFENAATALTEIRQTGKVRVQGEVWNAWSKDIIPAGTSVRIVGVKGLLLEVQAESEDKK